MTRHTHSQNLVGVIESIFADGNIISGHGGRAKIKTTMMIGTRDIIKVTTEAKAVVVKEMVENILSTEDVIGARLKNIEIRCIAVGKIV